MFGKKRQIKFDPSQQEPVLHKSICTGETTAGFIDIATGKYHDYCKIMSEDDIEAFCRDTGIDRGQIRTVY